MWYTIMKQHFMLNVIHIINAIDIAHIIIKTTDFLKTTDMNRELACQLLYWEILTRACQIPINFVMILASLGKMSTTKYLKRTKINHSCVITNIAIYTHKLFYILSYIIPDNKHLFTAIDEWPHECHEPSRAKIGLNP